MDPAGAFQSRRGDFAWCNHFGKRGKEAVQGKSAVAEMCESCGRTTGKLEAAHLYDGHVVCGDCIGKLRGAAGTPPIQYALPLPPVIYPPQVQTIEQTGKKWKAMQLFSALACIVGVIFACAGFNAAGGNGVSPLGLLGSLLCFGGLIAFVVARIGAWWYHG